MQGLVSKATAIAYSGAALVALSALLAGCGDDDDGGPDAGMDAGLDAGEREDGGFIRRPDARMTQGDPIPECERFDPDACGPGQRCHLLARRLPGETQFIVYPGCLEDTPAPRAEGDPCDPWGGFARAYRAEGLEDEVYIDPCADGLYCAADARVRGSFTCQRACESGILGCSGEGEYCASDRSGLEFCRASDQCDPTNPTACGIGAGCYLRLDDRNTGVLTVCLPTVPDPLADGTPCQYLNDCEPGSSCWGSSRLPPELWTSLTCQRSCTVGAVPSSDEDAGALDEDAGPPPAGGCRGGLSCEPLSESGLNLERAGEKLGQCE